MNDERRTLGASAVQVHIGELVLRGFPPERRYAIAEACQREIARLLTASPRIGVDLAAAPSPLASSASVDPNGAPERVGSAIARAVVRRLR